MKYDVLITVEGIDGCGKTVQSRRLSEYFYRRGYSVKEASFPRYDSLAGKEIKDRLYNGKPAPKDMCLWYAVDRLIYQSSQPKFEEHDTPTVYIYNRYVTSNAIYQSDAEWEMAEWVYQLEYDYFKLRKPDLEIILDVDPYVAKNLMESRYGGLEKKKDINEMDIEFQARCRERYIRIAKEDTRYKRVVIPCCQNDKLLPEDVIHSYVVNSFTIPELFQWDI